MSNINTWRPRIFTAFTGILAFVFVIIIGAVTMLEVTNIQEEIHRWHQAELAALGVMLLGGAMMSLLWRPQQKPLLVQFFGLSVILLSIGIGFFQIQALGLIVLALAFMAVYPRTGDLFRFWHKGAVGISSLVLSLIAAVLYLPEAWMELKWQIVGMTTHDVHALQFHWIASAVLIVLLVLAGVLASTRRPGWKELSVIAGGTFCYLGLIAMIAPDLTGSWGGARGMFAIIIGIWHILIPLLNTRKAEVSEPEIAQITQKQVVQAVPARRKTQHLVVVQ